MYARAQNVKALLVSAVVAMMLLVGASMAYANSGDDSEQQATGPGIEKAKSAALDSTSGGRVTGAEVGDEEGYYEIEVTKDDGSQVDVHLDKNYNVLSTPTDHEEANDQDGANDNGG